MTLGREHLQYPARRRGLDHDWFDHQSMPARKPLHWSGRRVAVWLTVHVEFFPMNMTAQPFKPIGGMDRAYPDFWGFSHREYGHRIGIYRIMRVLDRLGLRATAAMNSEVAVRYPELVADIVGRGWEVMASGTDMGHLIHGGLSRADEAALIRNSAATLRQATGQNVIGWHSPARSQSMHTFELVAQEKFSYVADWINDDLPYAVRTPAGPLYAMPLTHERSDATMLASYQQSTSEYESQQLAAFRRLHEEAGEHGGRIFSLAVHPWIIGQPHRIRSLERVLAEIMRTNAVWCATGDEIMAAFAAEGADGATRRVGKGV